MTGALLSPPRLTPRSRSVLPASSLNQLPSRCSIASLEESHAPAVTEFPWSPSCEQYVPRMAGGRGPPPFHPRSVRTGPCAPHSPAGRKPGLSHVSGLSATTRETRDRNRGPRATQDKLGERDPERC